MKKLAIILILGMISLVSVSQNSTTQDISMGYEQTWNKFIGRSSDIIGATDSTFMYTVRKYTKTDCEYIWRVVLDSISGTPDTVDCFFQYSVFGDTYTNLDTVTYYGTSDTAFEKKSSSTYVGDYHRLFIKERGSGFTVGIDTIKVKFIE